MSITPRSPDSPACRMLEKLGESDKFDSPNNSHPHRLPKALRLNQEAVAAVIKLGKRIRVSLPAKPGSQHNRRAMFNLKLLNAQLLPKAPLGVDVTNSISASKPQANRQSASRIAVAVPKRLLKSAVLRNKIKRWIRESFRPHAVRTVGIDMLITLEQQLDPKAQAKEARAELQQLFSDAMRQATQLSATHETRTGKSLGVAPHQAVLLDKFANKTSVIGSSDVSR